LSLRTQPFLGFGSVCLQRRIGYLWQEEAFVNRWVCFCLCTLLIASNFHLLYLAVGVAGVIAVIMALPFVAEKNRPLAAHEGRRKKRLKTCFVDGERLLGIMAF
jgi:hypothetical protein